MRLHFCCENQLKLIKPTHVFTYTQASNGKPLFINEKLQFQKQVRKKRKKKGFPHSLHSRFPKFHITFQWINEVTSFSTCYQLNGSTFFSLSLILNQLKVRGERVANDAGGGKWGLKPAEERSITRVGYCGREGEMAVYSSVYLAWSLT